MLNPSVNKPPLRWWALAGLLMVVLGAQAQERPNILVILADDLGYNDVGFTGPTPIQTPQLDALAANGVIFSNGYVTHPYCGPSRAGLITGRYQARFGVEVNFTHSRFDEHSGLPVTEQTFARRLQTAGYRTGVIGKWHLGAAPPFHPNNRGFDYFYGFLSGGHSYFPDSVTNNHPLRLEDGRPHYSANEGSFLPLERNDDSAEFDEYLTTALSRDAARFVSEGDGPFFLYLAYNAPHAPLEAPRALINKYQDIEPRERRIYAAMIDAMDQGIGMVVEALKASGQFENTLIFFLSDNGGVVAKPGHEREIWADNFPFRGGKGSMIEGGSHVPFIAHWPAGIPAGTVYEMPISSLDIAATAVALGQGDTSGESLEGVNLIPFINGEQQGPPHEAIYWRMRDGVHWAVRTPTAKYLLGRDSTDGPELYDMVQDPYETNNLVHERPELRRELAAMWNQWNSDNQPNRFLQSGEYQTARLRFYDDMRARLDAAAEDREPVVID